MRLAFFVSGGVGTVPLQTGRALTNSGNTDVLRRVGIEE